MLQHLSTNKARMTKAASWMALSLSLGCASYTKETENIRRSYRAESYNQALKEIEDSDIKSENRNKLLYLLERSMILDRLGKEDTSRSSLLQASDLSEKLYRTSILGDAVSFFYNDSTTDYQGEDYEKVSIHTMLALSFLGDRKFSEATVEARKINSLLNEINNFYEENKNRYAEDAFARYLSGMIYEDKGEIDSAIIDYRAALRLYETSYSEHFYTTAPDHLVQALYDLYVKRGRANEATLLKKKYNLRGTSKPGLGDLVVIHEVGTIAYKVSEDFVLPVSNQVVRFSFPVIRGGGLGNYGKTGVAVKGKKFASGEMVQYMDEIARKTLEDKRFRVTAKSMARLLIKGQLTSQARKQFGVIGALGANIYGAVTETADTRGWTLLPSAFYVTRIQLPPGKHTITTYTDDRSSKAQVVQIHEGKLTFVRAK
jgi:hypothetical protein